MDYRDERDALRGRVENLEQALDEAKRTQRSDGEAARIAQLEEQLADALGALQEIRRGLSEVKGAEEAPQPPTQDIEANGGAPQPDPPLPDPRRGVAMVLGGLAIGVLAVVLAARRSAHTPRPVEPAPPSLAPVQTVAPVQTLAPVQIGESSIPCRVTLALSKSGSGPGAFDEPRRIAIDAEGSAYVADKTGRIQRFDREGNLVSTIHAETTNTPHGPLSTDIGFVEGLAVDSEHVFASIGYDVVAYDAAKGNVVTKVPHAFPSTCFRQIVVDQTGALLVRSACTDSDRYQMVRMNVRGRVRATFPEGRAWQLDTSDKMGVDGAGNIYAPHRYENQIYVLDRRGKETRRIGMINKPGPVVIDAQSRLFVTSWNGDIVMFDTDGRLLGLLAKCWQRQSPNDLAIGPDGQLWVADESGVVRLAVGPPR